MYTHTGINWRKENLKSRTDVTIRKKLDIINKSKPKAIYM